MVKVKMAVLVLAGIFGLRQICWAQNDNEAFKTNIAKCIKCHGEKGIGVKDSYPNLAGQKKEYLLKQMKSFKDGTRRDMYMSAAVNGLTDQEIQDLVNYFAGL